MNVLGVSVADYVAGVDYHLLKAMEEVADHLLDCLRSQTGGSEVVVVVVGSRVVVVVGAADYRLVQNQGFYHHRSVQYLLLLLLLLKFPFPSPFLYDRSRRFPFPLPSGTFPHIL
jgi:prevent-host-death family protein